MQTTVQNSDVIRMWSVKFSADFGNGYVDLWALKDAQLTVNKQKTEFTFDNAKMTPKVKIIDAILSANLYELALDTIQKLNGLGILTTTAWTSTAHTQNIWNVAANQVVVLECQNGDWTAIASLTSLKSGNTAIQDYSLVSVGGKTAIAFESAKTNVVAVYNYTPNASKELLFKDIITSQSLNKYKFENENADWKKLIIEFFEWFNNSDSFEIAFQPDDTTDDAASMAVEIKAFPTSDNKLFRIIDEQDNQ